jgi:putative membrane protein
MMVDEHEAAVRKFENAANNAKDAEIKALATEALPKLRGHLEMAKAVRDKVKG